MLLTAEELLDIFEQTLVERAHARAPDRAVVRAALARAHGDAEQLARRIERDEAAAMFVAMAW